ncbi:RecQ family ATP-dependent DNA helicase [Algiphilus sp.]|uniref:RecQ family ATP-dependent DNA helicase n=1 Tax=Algiphilus sp. TaxID=1872431 RepID=UPI003B51C3A7
MHRLAEAEQVLTTLGYAGFRPGQQKAIDTLLEHGRTLLVAPTGGGKSLCYQVPALMMPGTTVVVSPLVALMADQVAALQARGVAATYLAATLSPDELQRRLEGLWSGAFRLVYIAPERLAAPGFRNRLAQIDCPLIAVDEAHCISEWGHDFRPEYMQIGDLVRELAPPHVLACTATATPVVRDEIVNRLGLGADTPQLIHGFARPNLALRATEVNGQRERQRVVDAALKEALGAPGGKRGLAIVYTPTRKLAESEAGRLAGLGWRTRSYHAGLPAEDRQLAQEDFAQGHIDLICATNAFGMGIDRADVRAVVHFAPPGSIEAYYQEVGRAGRDGKDAIGVLCWAQSDLPQRRRLLESPGGEQASDQGEIVEHKWNLFLELIRWAEGGSCRHDAILRYFGDEAETLAGCGRCDVCLTLDDGGTDEDATLLAQQLLSAVARVHGRLGMKMAVALLRGEHDAKLERMGLTQVRTYGLLAERPREWIQRALGRCVTAGWISFSGDDYPVLRLTEEGGAVMRGAQPARWLPPAQGTPSQRRAPGGRRAPAAAEASLDAASQAAFDALRAARLAIAQQEGVPAYVVAHDRTLRAIAERRPDSLDALREVPGLGAAKIARYGEALLDALSGH